MKKVSKIIVSLLLLSTLCACGMFNNTENEVNDQSDKVEDKVENNEKEESTLSDLMYYLKNNGVMYESEEALNSFEFAAKEGTSFMVDGEKVYAYRVDTNDENIRNIMYEAEQNNSIRASQNGVENEYGASVNGDYLMIYDIDAKVDELLAKFKEFKNENNSAS